MQAKEIISKKRDGEENSKPELQFLLEAYLKSEVKDYQMAAWLMAVFFRGMTPRELADWTELMWHSGVTFPRETREDYWIDKHSTGGVGDKPSLILVPLVALACEKLLGAAKVKLPMVSGRGLGHTGGTLDKLESVPGFSPFISIERALELLRVNGFFMMGQTATLAPADQRLYALRDVTATVESIPLIVSSIMSKKLSENIDGILFDVKTGAGAFMPNEAKSRELAVGLLKVAKAQGIDSVALLTRMDEPLGYKVGNHLEVEECADFLSGLPREPALSEIVLESAAWMIHLGARKTVSRERAREVCVEILSSGAGLPLFKRMFESQGGSWEKFQAERTDFKNQMLNFDYLAERTGWVAFIKAREMGVLLVDLGGGRKTKEENIDFKVGFEFLKKVGDSVKKGEPIVRVYYRKAEQLKRIQESLTGAIGIDEKMKLRVESWIVETLT